jgi:hypothetical protein
MEEQVTFPAKNKVCPECEGQGFVLREGMRNYAYTAEEFNEAFWDDEDREAYFTRGGKYDQVCPCCNGKNVVPVPNPAVMSAAQKLQFQQWEKQEASMARSRAEDARTMRMESGCYDY